jgi:hypothetical protein
MRRRAWYGYTPDAVVGAVEVSPVCVRMHLCVRRLSFRAGGKHAVTAGLRRRTRADGGGAAAGAHLSSAPSPGTQPCLSAICQAEGRSGRPRSRRTVYGAQERFVVTSVLEAVSRASASPFSAGTIRVVHVCCAERRRGQQWKCKTQTVQPHCTLPLRTGAAA